MDRVAADKGGSSAIKGPKSEKALKLNQKMLALTSLAKMPFNTPRSSRLEKEMLLESGRDFHKIHNQNQSESANPLVKNLSKECSQYRQMEEDAIQRTLLVTKGSQLKVQTLKNYINKKNVRESMLRDYFIQQTGSKNKTDRSPQDRFITAS